MVSLPSIEGSYSLHTVKGPTDFDDPDIPALLVMAELLDTTEGIFWKLIRGQGLAYSCYLHVDVEVGLINFAIFKSPDAFKAFAQAKKLVDQLANNQVCISLTPLSDGLSNAQNQSDGN